MRPLIRANSWILTISIALLLRLVLSEVASASGTAVTLMPQDMKKFEGAGELDGRWSGPGVAEMNPGSPKSKKRHCSRIGLELRQDEERIALKAGFYECEDLKAEYGSAEFLIRAGRVYLDGKAIGTFDGKLLDLTVFDQTDGVEFHLRLEPRGLGPLRRLNYLEEWIEGGRLRLTVIGELRQA